MAMLPIPVGGDYDLWLDGASVRATAAYLNSATVTYALYEADRTTAVAGGTGTLAYVAASDGNYLGRVESTVTATLTPGAAYWVKYVAVSSPYDGVWWRQTWAE